MSRIIVNLPRVFNTREKWLTMSLLVLSMKKHMDTTSPYGLPLKIDLPGISPDWNEEEGDDDEQ